MPYASNAQRRFFHSKGARKAGLSPSQVAEYDQASKGKKLPEHVKNHKPVKRGNPHGIGY